MSVKGFKYDLAASLMILATLFLLPACKDHEATGILSRQEMVKVMAEVYLVEDKINRLSLPPDSSHQLFEVMRKKIATKTGVSDSVFHKSLEYYSSRPLEMEKIYTALVDSLTLWEQRSTTSDHP